ncbi:MAG: hypothetical protein R3247_12970, partial [Rhodothermales bacterium]|nr:hypothetical protein [Rhodothermales bacterium]
MKPALFFCLAALAGAACEAPRPALEDAAPVEAAGAWAADAVFYQIFPERFRNGDPANDPTRESLEWHANPPPTWQLSSWTADWYARLPWEEAASENFYDTVYHRRYGGDLQGVIDKLDYLKELG